jgi:GT2 family glycosyltransferase
MQKISIVIPVYNAWHLVKRNIDALIKFERENLLEIIIVDDNSPECNPYIFDSDIVETVTNVNNLGYTATVNKGLKMAASEVVVLLDSDAYPINPFTAQLLKLYEDSTVGCIGFRTVDEVGKSTGSFERFEPTVVGLIVGQQLQSTFDKVRLFRQQKILPFSCCISFRKKCLEELEYFDACSFPTLEADNDIAIRIHRSGWRLLLSEQITFCHAGGNSYKINYKRVLLHHEGRWKLLKKHHKIKLPSLVRELIKTRIKLELLVLTLLSIIHREKTQFEEKIQGRKVILKHVNGFR